MPERSLNRIDLNLLTVFATLMQERSVTRAGRRLNLSQPATSGALTRLREVFREPLFIRTGRRSIRRPMRATSASAVPTTPRSRCCRR